MGGGGGGGGPIRLIVGFQPLMVISPRCMRGDLMWTCLVWAERSTPDNFWVPSHWFNSTTGEQKGITQTIYTDSAPPNRMPNSLMPSGKLRSANLPILMSLVWHGRGSNPGLPQVDALTTMLHGGGVEAVGDYIWLESDLIWGETGNLNTVVVEQQLGGVITSYITLSVSGALFISPLQ